ncbi:MAG: tryptophan--tRNA ligase [Ezakiella sp.]|nr:tryptophan--tRNA ligase [Ezakiella sp.]MDD7471836.1 tryptophan--tRNA ligase [Bacillota bacterium]MDY3923800.1 tryptophan--tRNA ligase [Ezakiella sp.]
MKTIYSAIQPSGELTIGNFLGTLKGWKDFQDEYKCLFGVADMHAITVRQNPQLLRERTKKLLAIYLATGLDPDKSIIYVNSHVKQHAELGWVLHTYTNLGQLNRMHQFKSKIKDNEERANVGLYCYPVLMASDILLYDTDFVPVGDDQKQHVEITRDIAERFNSIYGDTFTIPEPLINKSGSRIKSLQDPTVKMSKSDPNPNAFILLLEEYNVMKKKISRAVTDSIGEINYSEDQPGIMNLLDIYKACNNEDMDTIFAKFEGQNYGYLKREVTEALETTIGPVREKTKDYLNNEDYLLEVAKKGSEKASEIAEKTLAKVYDKIGFLRSI